MTGNNNPDQSSLWELRKPAQEPLFDQGADIAAQPQPPAPADVRPPSPQVAATNAAERDAEFDRLDAQGQGNARIQRAKAEVDDVTFVSPDHRLQRIADQLSRRAVELAVSAGRSVKGSSGSAKTDEKKFKPARGKRTAKFLRQSDGPPDHIAKQTRNYRS